MAGQVSTDFGLQSLALGRTRLTSRRFKLRYISPLAVDPTVSSDFFWPEYSVMAAKPLGP